MHAQIRMTSRDFPNHSQIELIADQTVQDGITLGILIGELRHSNVSFTFSTKDGFLRLPLVPPSAPPQGE